MNRWAAATGRLAPILARSFAEKLAYWASNWFRNASAPSTIPQQIAASFGAMKPPLYLSISMIYVFTVSFRPARHVCSLSDPVPGAEQLQVMALGSAVLP